LAIFSDRMRMRPACARRPEAAMAIDLRKSIYALQFMVSMILSGIMLSACRARS
jgi:hypothetical protein